MESSRGILRFLEDYRSSIVICGAPTFFLPLLFFFPDNEKTFSDETTTIGLHTGRSKGMHIGLVAAIIAVILPSKAAYHDFDVKQAQCAYVVSIMGFYWMFEVLPLAITALIPMVAFPFFEIMKSEDVAQAYLPDTSFLFIGGLMVAVAVEKSELHTRIALFVLKTVGSRPKWIMAGFMGVTGFLSMWISNTATAALMVPIVQSVITELVTNHRGLIALTPTTHLNCMSVGNPVVPQMFTLSHHSNRYPNTREIMSSRMHEILALSEVHSIENRRRSVDMRRLSIPQENVLVAHQKDMSNLFTPREHLMAKGLLISVCFAANIGGSATITGTASNLVLLGQLEKLFPNADTGINFLSWITFAFPQAVLCLAFCWFVLNIVFLRNAPQGSAIVSRKLKEKYDKLPSTTFAEVAVMVCFVLLLGLWMLREPQIIPGFGAYFKRGYITDATSAVFVVLLLFIIPDKKPMCYQRDRGRSGHYTVRNSLLDWPTIQERFPWSVVLLLGGGFALAAGVKESHLSIEIGEVMHRLSVFPVNVIMFICICITVGLTNICSNTVIASIFIPIVAELARSLDINPLLFMLPVAISSSFAFLFPVATPPNAIVFGTGLVQVTDMPNSAYSHRRRGFAFGWPPLGLGTFPGQLGQGDPMVSLKCDQESDDSFLRLCKSERQNFDIFPRVIRRYATSCLFE
ncbi:hypothetical protein RB195_021905 [Necator americanus]|uniref:Uncharacterized protein n=1 Tax=Necator americanus TaxID=51031 RepID=A0ABR1EFS6_NECAM